MRRKRKIERRLDTAAYVVRVYKYNEQYEGYVSIFVGPHFPDAVKEKLTPLHFDYHTCIDFKAAPGSDKRQAFLVGLSVAKKELREKVSMFQRKISLYEKTIEDISLTFEETRCPQQTLF